MKNILVLEDVYAACEKKIKNLNTKLFNAIKKNSKKTIIKRNKNKKFNEIIRPYFSKNNIIVFMGAGSITNLAKEFVKEIK